jgi:hypothetical protein
LPFGTVLFDSWYLPEEFVIFLRRHRKDWISILKKNRNLETNSFALKDAQGKRIPLEGSHLSPLGDQFSKCRSVFVFIRQTTGLCPGLIFRRFFSKYNYRVIYINIPSRRNVFCPLGKRQYCNNANP